MNSHSPFHAHPSAILRGLLVARCSTLTRLSRRRLLRKLICFALISSLLVLLGPGLNQGDVRALASTAVDLSTAPIRNLQPILRLLSWFRPARPRQESLAERLAHVARLRVSPSKFVAYQDQAVAFTALPTNLAGETIQGVRVEWSSSETSIASIDDSGRAVFLQPGIVRIICRAGLVRASAPVLVRPGRRPVQTDDEWRLDQSLFTAVGIPANGPGGSGARASGDGKSSNLITSLIDRLTPTVYAQTSGYSNNDFPFDELWSEPRNLVGSPRDRTLETTGCAERR